MMKFQSGPAITDLQKRLYNVLPEYREISKFREGKWGTYKAIDGTGSVYLVTLSRNAEGVFSRYQEKVMDYQQLVSQSGSVVGPKIRQANEGWEIPEAVPIGKSSHFDDAGW